MKVLAAVLSVTPIVGVALAAPNPEASLPALLKRQAQPGNLALKATYENVITNISIGTPPQEVELEVFIGPGGLDVAPGWCDGYTDAPASACFRNGSSSTYSSQGGGSDTVTIGGFTVENVPFSAGENSAFHQSTGSTLNIEAPNGTVSSAQPCPTAAGNRTAGCVDVDDLPPPSIWPSFRSQWPEPRIGIYIAKFPLEIVQDAGPDIDDFVGLPNGSDAGTITLGGLNNDLFTGDVAYVDLSSDPARSPVQGAIPLRGLTVNGQSISLQTATTPGDSTGSSSPTDHIVLTTTQGIEFPIPLLDKVKTALAASDLSKGWGIPCDTTSTISLGITGKTFEIKVSDLIVKNGSSCYWPTNLGPGVRGAVAIGGEGITTPIFVGIPLLSSYVVFDYKENKIGFADLSDQTTSGGSGGSGSGGSGSNTTSTGGTSASPRTMAMSLGAVCGAFMAFVLPC